MIMKTSIWLFNSQQNHEDKTNQKFSCYANNCGEYQEPIKRNTVLFINSLKKKKKKKKPTIQFHWIWRNIWTNLEKPI